MIDKSLRLFSRFGCRIYITEICGGLVHDSETFTEFVCAYSLKWLEIAGHHIYRFLPKKFCRVRLEFYLIESVFSGDKHEYSNLIVRNADDLQSRIMRNVVFVLTLNHFTNNEN